MPAYVNRIATAVPPFEVHRKFVDYAPSLLTDERSRRLFRRMADRSQIERRWSFFEPAPEAEAIDRAGFFRRGAFPDTAERMRFFERHAPGLAFASLEELGIADQRDRITHLIVTCCTGFYAPGLDLQIIERFGLNPGIERTLVGFMGCHAAISALKLARHIVRSEPDSVVLVLSLELCTLHLQETADLETLLSFLIFADGCAAALVSAEPDGIALEGFRTVVLPGTAGNITWRIEERGFGMFLSGAVPGCLAAGLPAALPGILNGRPPEEVELWAVHPGGRTVLDAVEQAAGLDEDRLACSRGVLRDYGNMSSATVMFVLQRMLDRFRATGIGGNGAGCALAFGPGMTAESMTFRLTAA